jgi:hypothetical protein
MYLPLDSVIVFDRLSELHPVLEVNCLDGSGPGDWYIFGRDPIAPELVQ